jgi:hypothetical protein
MEQGPERFFEKKIWPGMYITYLKGLAERKLMTIAFSCSSNNFVPHFLPICMIPNTSRGVSSFCNNVIF